LDLGDHPGKFIKQMIVHWKGWYHTIETGFNAWAGVRSWKCQPLETLWYCILFNFVD